VNNKHFTQLTPIYLMQEPNEPITLYEGAMEIPDNRQLIQGTGILKLTWLPSLEIKFEMDITTPDVNSLMKENLLPGITHDCDELRFIGTDLNPVKVYITCIERSKAIGKLLKSQQLLKMQTKDYSMYYFI
jgi:hypothetical protein